MFKSITINQYPYLNYNNLKMVQRILWPARTVPLMVPETLETPTRLRYFTGTSTHLSLCLAAFTCISTV